jgi:hypothetical protein
MTSPILSTEELLWAPLVCACVHIFEEFVFPGGFKAWYQQYRGADVTSVTTPFLVFINALLLAGCVNVATAGRERAMLPYWMGITGVLASNGIWHLYAAWRSRRYSPGMVTGALLYVPLAVYGCAVLFRSGGFPIWQGVAGILIGSLYTTWAAFYHGRHRAGTVAQTAA